MRRWRTVLGATVAALVLTSGGAAQAAQELHPTTKANLQAAMHAEAFAYAKYTLFAEAAASSGHPDVAALFGRTAGVELRDHFTAESKLLGFVGSNLANLQVGISGESQDLTDYARWAQEATTDGCDAAAELFAEVRRDEAGHLVRYTAAVQALVDPETGATVPAPPTVTPVAVRPGPATCSARTVPNLQAAMAGEAFAYAKYTLFADTRVPPASRSWRRCSPPPPRWSCGSTSPARPTSPAWSAAPRPTCGPRSPARPRTWRCTALMRRPRPESATGPPPSCSARFSGTSRATKLHSTTPWRR